MNKSIIILDAKAEMFENIEAHRKTSILIKEGCIKEKISQDQMRNHESKTTQKFFVFFSSNNIEKEA